MTGHRRCENHRPVRAVRYEAERTVIVACCFECGEENWPLYDRSYAERNGRPHEVARACPACGDTFSVPTNRPDQRYCSVVCGTRSPLAVNFGTRRRAS